MQNTLALCGPARIEQYFITQALKMCGQLRAPNGPLVLVVCITFAHMIPLLS